MKLFIIVGLPGSGKTHLAKSMLDDDSILIDDPKKIDVLFDEILLSDKKKIITTSPHFCLESNIEKVIDFCVPRGIDYELIFFECRQDLCMKNSAERDIKENRNKNSNITIEKYSKEYPKNRYWKFAKIMKVYSGENDGQTAK